jgi:hypothetical protein
LDADLQATHLPALVENFEKYFSVGGETWICADLPISFPDLYSGGLSKIGMGQKLNHPIHSFDVSCYAGVSLIFPYQLYMII